METNSVAHFRTYSKTWLMGARIAEAMLGCWLGMSLFIFRHQAGETALWIADWGAGAAAVVLACLSYWHPTRHAHLATIGVGLALAVFGYFWEPYPLPPASRNHLLVGSLLFMMAVIPNNASKPSRAWDAFEDRLSAR